MNWSTRARRIPAAFAAALVAVSVVTSIATAPRSEASQAPAASLVQGITAENPSIGEDMAVTSVARFDHDGGMALIAPGTAQEEAISYDGVDPVAGTLIAISRGSSAAAHSARTVVEPVDRVPGRGLRLAPDPGARACTPGKPTLSEGLHLACATETGPDGSWNIETDVDTTWMNTHCKAAPADVTDPHIIAPLFAYNASTGNVELDWHKKIRDEIKSADRAIAESHKEFFQHMRVACTTDANGHWQNIWVPSLGITDGNSNGSIDCLDVSYVLQAHSVYGQATRRYMVYLDPTLGGASTICTTGGMTGARDTSMGTGNRANSAWGYSMLQAAWWDHEGTSNGSTSVSLHELGHSWGLVADTSPGSDGAQHTKDYPDMMNAGYYFPPQTPIRLNCTYQVTYQTPLTHFDSFMDCGGDDYWNDRPSTGNWLCTHFNLASDLLYFQPRSDRRYC